MARRLISLLLTGAVAASGMPAQAQEKGHDVSYSYYLVPCGTFIRHRESGPPTDINNTSDLFYIAGWISAHNRYKPQNAIPDDTSLDDVELWMEQYCTDNPLSNLEAGLARLSVEVKNRGKEEEDKAAVPPTTAPAPPKPKKPVPPPAPLDTPPFHVPITGLKPLPE